MKTYMVQACRSLVGNCIPVVIKTNDIVSYADEMLKDQFVDYVRYVEINTFTKHTRRSQG